ncbi:MAG: hypothetical protein ACHBN1_21810 [Heteroscytonema crispum UTEX LB 1556]
MVSGWWLMVSTAWEFVVLFDQQPNGRTSYLRECYQKRSTRFTNHQSTNTQQPPTRLPTTNY